jgi:hypothetical protein
MQMIYDRITTEEFRGNTQADLLIALEANFRVVSGGAVVFGEPRFPVVELARSLLIWLGSPDRGDFEFESMSYEEVGPVEFRQTPAGWIFGSVFRPGASTPPIDWGEVDSCCRGLISRVEGDLVALGLDPGEVLRR